MSKAYIVVDLGFGDQGKGTTVDYLVRSTGAGTIVRFNGGGQAAHHVVTPDGRWHKFSMFGAGMFVDDTTTFLSKHVLISPRAMMKEAAHMETLGIHDPMARTFIDAEAPIIAPFQQATNRIVELQRGDAAHGSCGIGIGETMEDLLTTPEIVIRAGDLCYPNIVLEKLKLIRDLKRVKLDRLFPDKAALHIDAQVEFRDCFLDDKVFKFFLDAYAEFIGRVHIVSRRTVADIINQSRPIVFEGAQGVLLDEWHGFHPHTTWSTTTFENAEEVLKDAGFRGSVERIGVTRAYGTRHGAGPFPTEDVDMTRRLPEQHNSHNRWQGNFRAGWLDLVTLKYACSVVGRMDYLSVTCLDRIQHLGEVKVATHYRIDDRYLTKLHVSSDRDLSLRNNVAMALDIAIPFYDDVGTVTGLLDRIRTETGVPPQLLSFGPSAADKHVSAVGSPT